jgi:hypothetical protein
MMKVWIEQDLCTGDGLCEEVAPAVFMLLDDGLSYVKEGDKVFDNLAALKVWLTFPKTSRKRSKRPHESVPARVSSSSSGFPWADAAKESPASREAPRFHESMISRLGCASRGADRGAGG